MRSNPSSPHCSAPWATPRRRRAARPVARPVDADLAANTLGWQWTGGTGADAAPYFRIFNPVLQGERFDPDGAYVKRYVPELARVPAAVLHKAWTLKPSEQATFGIRDVYARPVLDLAKTRDAALTAYASIKRL